MRVQHILTADHQLVLRLECAMAQFQIDPCLAGTVRAQV